MKILRSELQLNICINKKTAMSEIFQTSQVLILGVKFYHQLFASRNSIASSTEP